MENNRLHIISVITTTICFAFLAFLIYYGLEQGLFNDNEKMANFIRQFGIIAPLIFVIVQMIQVVFPIIPGGATCLAGVILFGPFYGFIYNYIGMCVGSVIAYFLSLKYGEKMMRKLFKTEQVDKYMAHKHKKAFVGFFTFFICFPGFPDDLLCYIAGTSGMSLKQFLVIILLGRPFSLLGYSLGMNYIPKFFF